MKNSNNSLNPDYIQIHTHSIGSLRDGIMKVRDHVQFAVNNKKKYVSITDHGSVSEWIDLYTQCALEDVTPIYGIEGYIHIDRDKYLDDKEGKTNHIILLAQNEIGFNNIIKIHNDAWQNFYRRPVMSYKTLFKYNEGVIVGSACMGGTIPKYLAENNFADADKFACVMKEYFPDRFYIEIMLIDMDEQTELNRQLIKFAKKHDLPIIVGNDPHYIAKEDSKAHQISLLLQSGQTVKELETGKAWSFSAQDLYMKNENELYEDWKAKYSKDTVFTEEVFIQATWNVKKITDSIEKIYLEHPARLPKYDNGVEILESMAIKGLAEKIKTGIITEEQVEEYSKQVEYELKIISDLELVDYFLLINDIVNFCHKSEIAVGPGRGSVSASLVTYLMGITKLDPLKYNFIFERFLNPARKTRLRIF